MTPRLYHCRSRQTQLRLLPTPMDVTGIERRYRVQDGFAWLASRTPSLCKVSAVQDLGNFG